MKRFVDLSYRSKLLITYLTIVLLIVAVITTTIIASTSGQLHSLSTGSLYLLTEQALINYVNGAQSAERYLYSMTVSSGTARQMRQLRAEGSDYWPAQQELWYSLSKMIDSHAMYDHVAVRLEDGTFVNSYTYDLDVVEQSRTLLSQPGFTEKSYGRIDWARTGDGHIYIIRDVYDTSPLSYVGKMCARIRQEQIVTMSGDRAYQNCTIYFFDQDGEMIMGIGALSEQLERAAASLLHTEGSSVSAEGSSYAAARMSMQGWTAVGFMPMSAVERLQNSVMQSGMVAALVGIVLGLAIAIAMSRQLSGRISVLVDSMHRVEAGDLSVSVPVQGKDEIGVLTGQFNRMTAKTKELLQNLVQEENSKRQAEFMNLEYEYRFLQWQVNPHFIYNALETINALAKMDGNDETSDMIVLLSDYFRKNAEAIRKKFVTVSQEFDSLRQYAEIYYAIYGDTLGVEFEIEPQAQDAYLPTMIMQPILENALVHGTSAAARAVIRTQARIDGDMLIVSVTDNGAGMAQETIDRILCQREDMQDGTRTSLGVRNVLDRMHLLYGEAASMRIESEPGCGTCVSVSLPLGYEEKTTPFARL